MDTLLLALIFYMAGALTRTFTAFLMKVIESPDGELQFNAKYWATLALSIIASLMVALGTFSAIQLPPNPTPLTVLLLCAPMGYTINDGANRLTDLWTTLSNKKSGTG